MPSPLRETLSAKKDAQPRGEAIGHALLSDAPELVSVPPVRVREAARAALASLAMGLPAERGLLVLAGRGGRTPTVDAHGHAPTPDLALPAYAALARLSEEAQRLDRPVVREGEVEGRRASLLAVPLRGPVRDAAPPPLAPVERRARRLLPLHRALGVILLERARESPFTDEDAARAEALADHAGRALLAARLHEKAAVDPTTGALVRAALDGTLAMELALVGHAGLPLAIVLFELDGFAEFSEAKGRRAAEDALAEVAAEVREGTRAQDLLFRYGAGKLVLLLPGADAQGAAATAERVIAAVRTADDRRTGRARFRGSVSAGVAVFPLHGDRRGELLRRADQALYQALFERGGGVVQVWHAGIPRHALRADRLIGIVTGDPQRDYRNVLLLIDAIAAVSSLTDRQHMLAAILDMLVEIAVAERGIVFLREGDGVTRGAGGAEGGGPEKAAPSASQRLRTSETQRLVALSEAGERRRTTGDKGEARTGREDEDAPRLVVALAQDAQKRPIVTDGFARTVLEKTARTKLPVTILDGLAEEDPALEDELATLGLRTVICVPLLAKDRVVGAVYVDGREGSKEVLEPDLVFFRALAREAGIALENARLYEETLAARREVEDLNRRLAAKVKTQAVALEEAKAVIEGEIKTKYDYQKIVGKSPRMLETFKLLDRITETDVPVLVQGESGTGKELVAKAVHFNGPRGRKRFVSVNCAAIAPSLLESELFGHVKGAFTGADRDKPGLFEQADGGTIFLDEVQDMPGQLQRELLRVLQEKEVRRVGGKDVIPVNARVICAANRDLRILMRAGTFREDLYYRLAVVTIELPPLRERTEDIPLIAERFIVDACKAQGRRKVEIDRSAMRTLLRHAWPGNVRELHNVLERTLLLLDGDVITESSLALELREVKDLPESRRATPTGGESSLAARDLTSSSTGRMPAVSPSSSGRFTAVSAAAPATSGSGGFSLARSDSGSGRLAAIEPGALAPDIFSMSYKDAAEAFKAEYIRRVLAAHGGNVTRASEQSGLFRSSFHKIMRKLDVSAREMRGSGSGERRAAASGERPGAGEIDEG